MITAQMVGRLTRQAEAKGFSKDGKERTVVKFSLATEKGRKKDEGSQFVDCVWFAPSAKIAEWMTKGRQVYVTGRMVCREWETQDGQKRKSWEFLVDALELLGGKDATGGANPSETCEDAQGRADAVPVDDLPDALDDALVTPF